MVINKDSFMLYEQYNVSIPESTLIKLEDGIRNNKEMLLTIAASHYGFRNGNWTVYRHDTVKHDINTYVAPKPKPIIQQHRPKESEVFGHIIAADYKLTSFYDEFSKHHKLEKLTTDEYIELMDDVIIPYQRSNPNFDGLAYLELVGKLTHKDGIKKVLDKEFLTVSIGAMPNKLICSVCGADQTKKMCKHYGRKDNNTFMLAESLDYKELSFVNKPADPFGRIVRIHDGIESINEFQIDTINKATLDAMPLKDFFELTDGKTIICVDNICTVINREESRMKKTISYEQEFGKTALESKIAELGDNIQLQDSEIEDLTDRQFAIVQKDAEGTNRRFPINDEVNVKLAMHFLCDAADLSPTEREKAEASISKAAKKMGIDFELRVKEVSDSSDANSNEDNSSEQNTGEADTNTLQDEVVDQELKDLCDKLLEKLKVYGDEFYSEEGELKDEEKAPEKPSPLAVLFSILSSFASEVKYAGNMLGSSIDSYLQQLGKETIDKATKDSIQDEQTKLQDSIKELEEEIQLLTDQNMDLNRQLRTTFVEEIIAHKTALGILADSETADNTQYSKVPYESLKIILNDYRNMRIKLADSTVNNNTSIKTITDPTQIADSLTDSNNSDVDSNTNNELQKVSAQDAIEIINSLKMRHGF